MAPRLDGMDDSQQSGSASFPSPLVTASPLLPLRSLWIGFGLAGGYLLFALLAYVLPAQGLPASAAAIVAAIAGLMSFVYYFMCVHRLIRVLRTQPDWWSEYTPAGVVWKQFIPLYGIYVLYQWTGDVESYTNWRLNRKSKVGLGAFLGLFVGFIAMNSQSAAWLGFFLVFGSLALLYVPVWRALAVAAPDTSGGPRFDGTLGLR